MASKARLGRFFQAFSNSRTIPSGRSISTFIKQIVPLALLSLYPIITQLRSREKEGREFPGELMNQNRRHGRCCSLESIDIQIAKVEVAGSVPVSRFQLNNLAFALDALRRKAGTSLRST